MRDKKIAPAKPKRKSLCQTPAAMAEKKARVRYYDEPMATTATTEQVEQTSSGNVGSESGQQEIEATPSGSALINSPSYEHKRQRLLRKVELAKQVRAEQHVCFFKYSDQVPSTVNRRLSFS